MKIKNIALCLLLVLVGCQRDEEMEMGQISVSNERLEASYSSVLIGCSFQTNVTIKNVQAYLSTEADFSSAKSYSLTEKSKNTFGATIEGLKDASTYYVRYEVSNRWSSKMIDEVSEFKTIPYTIPTVQTSEVSEVRYSTAIVGGVITENGGQEIKECGIVYSKSPNPTIENSTKVESNITKEAYTCTLTNLDFATTYYARAYATNEKGTAYGEEVSFMTKAKTLATVTTTMATNVSYTSAIVGGNVTDDGGAEITERGICYSTSANPTTANTKITSGRGLGQFYCNLTDLQNGTTYYVRAYAVNEKGTAYGEEVSFTTFQHTYENGYEYVDLGLSVKWATFNVGASKVEDYGDYFAWGEVEPKEVYEWSTYKWCKGSATTLTKYNTIMSHGIVDNKTQLELSDDAARANWGGKWRMPTDAELTELRELCTWTWVTQNGKGGYQVNSKSNGNSIFLPASGVYIEVYIHGIDICMYLSNCIDPDHPYNAWGLGAEKDDSLPNRNDDHRYYGQSVRPVYDPNAAEPTLPMVITYTVTQITSTSVVVDGNVTSDGNASVTERGVVYATTQNPTTANTKITSGSGLGEFTCNLTDLQDGTTYYARAYAINAKGTSYGEEVSFTTKTKIIATIATTPATNVSYTSATVGGNVTDDGGAGVTERGICYSISANPTTANTKITSGRGLGQFTCNLTNLQDATTYYARAYAINEKGTAYGEEVSFTTKTKTTSTVTTNTPSEITYTQAMIQGTVSDDGGVTVTEKGICYSTSPNPTIGSNKQTNGSGIGTITCVFSDLQDGTTYYARAYAINALGVGYGNEVSFTTMTYEVPQITIANPTKYSVSTATIDCEVTFDGGLEVTERGVCYSTTSNPTYSNDIVKSGSGLGAYSCELTNLSENTTYYVRAYAKNAEGIGYSREISFTTRSRTYKDGYEYVDMGLSVKWASYNIGATKPEEYGDYFAWGETEPKEVYTWSTYKYCQGSETTLTKYNTNSSYGTVDNKTKLDAIDDAAVVNWGGSWRMPTDAEMAELRNNCTLTWTSQNGVNGCKMTSKRNGNSIFFPAAGCRYESSLLSAGSYGNYWSSSLNTDSPYYAYVLDFSSDSMDWYDDYRHYGFSVRPVCP